MIRALEARTELRAPSVREIQKRICGPEVSPLATFSLPLPRQKIMTELRAPDLKMAA
jgi:hypothetical protein